MNRISYRITVLIGLLTFSFAVSNDAFALKKPTAEQKRAIQQMIERAKDYMFGYNNCKGREMTARAAGDTAQAERYAERAAYFRAKVDEVGDQIVEKVDQDYGIPEPPGTTVGFDPDSKGYGYVPYTNDKNNIRVVICPEALKDGPGLVASTKLHELRHAWQVSQCYSTKPDYWTYCAFWSHWAEWDAYNKEEEYYDQGYTGDMPVAEKDLIKERIRNHASSASAASEKLYAVWITPNVKTQAGAPVNAPIKVNNGTGATPLVPISIEDERGWPIMPSDKFDVNIGPEADVLIPLTIDVPPLTEIGTVNAVSLIAGSGINTVTDTMYIIVAPRVDVTSGPPMVGSRGEMIPVMFTVENTGADEDTFTVDFSNPLGWTTTPVSPLVIPSGMSAPVVTTVTIPLVTPPWTANAIVCSVTSTTEPSEGSSAWVGLRVAESDLYPLAVESPGDSVPADATFEVEVPVRNGGGYVESFFDVFLEVRAEGGALEADEVVSVPTLPPGGVQDVGFPPIAISTPGTYTISVFTSLPGDADSVNDLVSIPLEIIGMNVKEWRKY